MLQSIFKLFGKRKPTPPPMGHPGLPPMVAMMMGGEPVALPDHVISQIMEQQRRQALRLWAAQTVHLIRMVSEGQGTSESSLLQVEAMWSRVRGNRAESSPWTDADTRALIEAVVRYGVQTLDLTITPVV